MQDGKRIDNPFYVRLKDRQDEEAKPTMSADRPGDLTDVLPTNSDSRAKESLLTFIDNSLNETRTDDNPPEMDISPLSEPPVVSDEGELLSLSSFPSFGVSPQPMAEEESDKGLEVR